MVTDAVRLNHSSVVRLKGLLGRRLDLMRRNRLLEEEEFFLLWPFLENHPADPEGSRVRSAPYSEITRGDWHGEFMGTWVATAAVVSMDGAEPELRPKLDSMVDAWLSTQQEDGYLGAYIARDRWKSWDLWIQAHDLVGLITYFEVTERQVALSAAVRIADRVLRDFGPGRRSLQATGPSGGMASSALLEPLLWLHRLTGDARYLEFALWMVDVDWELAGGPAIVSSLLEGQDVARISTGKGAEMLIDLAGLLELYRATGNERYFKAVRQAWETIAAQHLYVTGTASSSEAFRHDNHLVNDGVYRVGETCVTMTWLYLSLSLGRLTGERRYFDAVEQSAYNHLLAAQSPDGRGWAYYVGLRDSKRYGWHTDPDCCPTRGSRALSLMPRAVLGTDAQGIVINLYEACRGEIILDDGRKVGIHLESTYPAQGNVQVTIVLDEVASFRVRLRKPSWCSSWTIRVNDTAERSAASDGYACIDRLWANGDVIDLAMDMTPAFVVDRLGNYGRTAVVRGPLVFAADSEHLPPGLTLDDLMLHLPRDEPATSIRMVPTDDPFSVHLSAPVAMTRHTARRGPWPNQRYSSLRHDDKAAGVGSEALELVPFFEAGNSDAHCYAPLVRDRREPVLRITYQVWLPYRWREAAPSVGQV
jgi:uncharacterized protein